MKKSFIITTGLIVLAIVYLASCASTTKMATSGDKIGEIISRMSIQDKVGQMTQINLDVVCVGGIYNLEEPHRLDPAKLKSAIVDWKVGSILNCGGHAYPRSQWHEIVNGIQKVATSETNLKIPILYGIDAIHGANYVMESTLFPQQLAMAATFDTSLARKGAEVTAYETRAAGLPWNFSPVLDVGRQPLWSRFFETYGEDPNVCSAFGEATIKGYQGNSSNVDSYHVAACMKHFLGYSGARTGKDRTPAYIPDIQLREIYLPPFKKAVETGALTVMINSGEINGTPVHASKKILTDLLRTELGFKGVAVTDWEDIIKLKDNHKVAATLKDAVKMAVDAGIDMCMVPNDFEFTKLLIELVKEGKISEERLNISVRRILELKQKLGILEQWKPVSLAEYPDFASSSFQNRALEAAKACITLLQNKNNTLPIAKEKRILLTGPAADSHIMLNGAWSRTWQGTDTKFDNPNRTTILGALKQKLGDKISYAQGCTITESTNENEALELAKTNDLIVACIGEIPSTEKPGDINDLDMSVAQMSYVKKLIATGKPVILVLVENRPLIVREIADQCAAVVLAYQPGDFGGEALAQVLTGEHNPSGKLPFTYPKHNNSLILYDHKYTETIDPQFGHGAFQPQWEFGYGLSYGEVECSLITVDKTSFRKGESITLKATLKNKGNKEVNYSALLFMRDDVASITPAVKKLKHFQKVLIPANGTKEISFVLTPADFSFINEQLQQITEAGSFTILFESSEVTVQLMD